ncbi:MAG: type VI secretion system-associated protein TagF, partial [Beijerinckiaceae bacterium]
MGLGLFGKLPAKRDFVAASVPREFLTAWEEWMQASLSASKATLTDRWLAGYLQAPLWRFWLGTDICGLPATGVFMSSIDGVGRHFPLTIVSCGAPGTTLAPLDGSIGDAWYHGLEEFLLGCLDQTADFEQVLEKLSVLPSAAAATEPPPAVAVSEEQGTMILHTENVDDIP